MTLDPSYNLLRGSQFYDLHPRGTLSAAKLDGLSLLCFGFPTANARLIGRTTDGGTVSFLGCASHVCDYDADLNSTVWSRLSFSISPEDNFVFKYNGIGRNIDPHGFSGCGVWIAEANAQQAI